MKKLLICMALTATVGLALTSCNKEEYEETEPPLPTREVGSQEEHKPHKAPTAIGQGHECEARIGENSGNVY